MAILQSGNARVRILIDAPDQANSIVRQLLSTAVAGDHRWHHTDGIRLSRKV